MLKTGKWRDMLAVGALVLSASGCMIPVYHQPQGFSSTYYRHLRQAAPVLDSSTMTNPQLAVREESPPDETPEKSAWNDEKSTAETAKSGSWWSWIRRPLTFGAEPDSDAEEELPADEASAAPRTRR